MLPGPTSDPGATTVFPADRPDPGATTVIPGAGPAPAAPAVSAPRSAARSEPATALIPETRPQPRPGAGPTSGPPAAMGGSDDPPTVAVPVLVGAPGGPSVDPSADATRTIPRPAAAPGGSGALTERVTVPPTGPPGPDGPAGADGPDGEARRPRRRALTLTAGVLGLAAVLYGGDLALGAGDVPRGVLVAGVPVGGMPVADAEQRLRTEIEPRVAAPIVVTAGEARSEIDASTAGLAIDWPTTLEQAGHQPLNPITRIASFFTERETGVRTNVDQEALDSALNALGTIVNREPAEGSVRFEGATPVAVDPVPGQALDVPAAETVLQREWALGRPIPLPLAELAPTTDTQDVVKAMDEVAKPAVSAPVVVTGEQDVEGTLRPQDVAAALTFRAEGGALVPEINVQAVSEVLQPQLASSETPGRDAALDFSSGRPVVTPSKDGRGVDYEATLKDLLPVLTGTGDRKITAVYADQPADLTTDELKKLGITGVIGEFTTRGFAPDSGKNIRRAAQMINGKIIQPGETFSLNRATAPRTAANGFVEAGIISDGHASRGVGGGVSQVATTLYNAAYFAGMVDVQHKEHSFYISRYPAGREATVFGDAIDMRFRNDNPTGVMIQTAWTPQSITVRLFGTKRYEVTSTPGARTKPTEPEKVSIPKGDPCVESKGSPGFTVTDTRTLREISTGQVRRETRTVKYNPSPIVKCGDDD